MFYQRLAATALAAIMVSAGAARAQETAPAPVEASPAPEATAACCTVPARTPIEIELLDTMNSKANHNGDRFAFRLATPLTIDGHVVIPAGTAGVGEVVHAERARFGGRAGELILAARYLDLGGTHIPLRTLRFGLQHGRDSSATINTLNIAAAAAMPALSMLGYLIAGGEVNVPAGTRASAQIAAELTLAPAQ